MRHPANFWSNLPYVYAALGMLCLAADERARRVARPYQLLDLSFALVLLGMAIASFGWHASNCTAVHFVDIGLMNSVIAFFPLRFGFARLALTLTLTLTLALTLTLTLAPTLTLTLP